MRNVGHDCLEGKLAQDERVADFGDEDTGRAENCLVHPAPRLASSSYATKMSYIFQELHHEKVPVQGWLALASRSTSGKRG